MAFLDLPNEVLIQIFKYLLQRRDFRLRDIYSINLVNRRLYNLFNDQLYCYNITHQKSTALSWAAKNGYDSVARRLLDLGADINTNQSRASRSRLHARGIRNSWDGNPLALAVRNGHVAIVKLLLERGADPKGGRFCSEALLYTALVGGHEEIVRMLSEHSSSPSASLINFHNGLTALHVACHFRLSVSARYFLEEGADVNIRDIRGWTPLRHVLDWSRSRLELRSQRLEYISDVTANNSLAVSCSKESFETVAVLMEFGAVLDLDSIAHFLCNIPSSVYERAAQHADIRVRAFFNSKAVQKYLLANRRNPHRVRGDSTSRVSTTAESY